MRLRNVKNAKEIVNSSKYVLQNPKELKGKFQTVFNNDNPICIEIGMGKGQFIINMALAYPKINFIGIEMYESIVCRAVQKLEKMDNVPNLRLICCDAKELEDIFAKEIDKVYLNFSDPWPKKRHAKRRLTSEVFLKVYDKIFKGQPTIIQKTDNESLFESSVVSLTNYGYKIDEISLDLHNTDKPNILTEYEEKFSKKGVKIKYLKATK